MTVTEFAQAAIDEFDQEKMPTDELVMWSAKDDYAFFRDYFHCDCYADQWFAQRSDNWIDAVLSVCYTLDEAAIDVLAAFQYN